jgi:hypothetical protein
VLEPSGTTSQGWPIYERPFGYLFTVVVEARPGPSNRPVGSNAFRHDPFDPSVRSDLEIIVSRALGDGSVAVCDAMLPFIGGVPPSTGFQNTQAVSDAINDFACRFVNGDGVPGGRGSPGLACTAFADGEYRFVVPTTRMQFCAGIAEPFGFPLGDTVITVRVRDVTGAPSPPASLILRVVD